jgi:hypothetical protein
MKSAKKPLRTERTSPPPRERPGVRAIHPPPLPRGDKGGSSRKVSPFPEPPRAYGYHALQTLQLPQLTPPAAPLTIP